MRPLTPAGHHHAADRELALGPWQRWTLIIVTGLLWVSGAAWLYLKFFAQVPGDLGPGANPAQPLWMRIHGAAAMGFLMAFGALLLRHVPMGWKDGRERRIGGLLTAVCAVLIITGWGLYYLVDQRLRSATSLLHWAVGLLLPAIIAIHAAVGRRHKRQDKHLPSP